MPETVTAGEVIERIRAIRATGSQTVLVAIDGHGGAGKSTLAWRVRDHLDQVTVVCLDAFSRPTVPGWDWDRFRAQILNPILDDSPARYQCWDWEQDRPGEWLDVPVGSIVFLRELVLSEGKSVIPGICRSGWPPPPPCGFNEGSTETAKR